MMLHEKRKKKGITMPNGRKFECTGRNLTAEWTINIHHIYMYTVTLSLVFNQGHIIKKESALLLECQTSNHTGSPYK